MKHLITILLFLPTVLFAQLPTIDEPQHSDAHFTPSRGVPSTTRNDTLRTYMAPKNLGTIALSPGSDFLPDSLRGNFFYSSSDSKWYFVAYDRTYIDVTSGGGGGSGTVESVVAGTGISVDDTDPANPIVTNSSPDQVVSLNEGSNVTVSGTYPNFTITVPSLEDGDADPTNERQTLSLVSTDLSISDGNTVDLSTIQDGTGTDDQTLSFANPNLSIEGGNSVDLSALQDGTGTDDQTLSFSNPNLSIEGGNSVDLSALQDGVNDPDADPTNELQTISKVGSTVTLSDGGGSFTDDDTQLNETQVDAFVANNGYLTSEVDGSTTNEIQTPSFDPATRELSLSGTATTTEINSEIEYNDFYTVQSHLASDDGQTHVMFPEGGEYTDGDFTGQVKFTLPKSETNARYILKIQVTASDDEAFDNLGTLVFSWRERSGGGIDRSSAWVEATGNTVLDTLVWGADDAGGVTSIAIGEADTYWPQPYNFKVVSLSCMDCVHSIADQYATGWSVSVVTNIVTNGIGFTPMKGLQGKTGTGNRDMIVVEYPAKASWSAGDTGRDLLDQYIRVKIPLENRRISGAFYHFQMKVHNDRETGHGQVRTFDVYGDYNAGNFGVLRYDISGNQGTDMPLRVYSPNRDSSAWLFFGDGTEDYEHEKIVVTRFEWSVQRYYGTEWGNYNNGWEVGLSPTIDKPTDSGPYLPNRQRLELDGTELTYNGSSVDLAPAITGDGNGILEDAGPHNLNDGTVVRGATESGGSIGRWELGNAVSAGGTGFNYLRMYGNSSRGLNLQMQVNESTGDVTDASLSLSNPIDETEFTHDGDWTFTSAGSYRRGFDWTLNALLFSGADYILLPSSSPDQDNSRPVWNSDKTFEWRKEYYRSNGSISLTGTSSYLSDAGIQNIPVSSSERYEFKIVVTYSSGNASHDVEWRMVLDAGGVVGAVVDGLEGPTTTSGVAGPHALGSETSQHQEVWTGFLTFSSSTNVDFQFRNSNGTGGNIGDVSIELKAR